MTAEPFCEAVVDVHISRDDKLTEPTARTIRQNIEGRATVCGPSPKPAKSTPAPKAKKPEVELS